MPNDAPEAGERNGKGVNAADLRPPDPPVLADRALPKGPSVSLQIMGWFFLNLLLVGVLAALLFTSHISPLLNVIISGRTGDRLDALAADVGERISGIPSDKWEEVLKGYSRRYKMDFALTRRDGDLHAGNVPAIPDSVIARIREFPGLRPPPPHAPQAARGTDFDGEPENTRRPSPPPLASNQPLPSDAPFRGGPEFPRREDALRAEEAEIRRPERPRAEQPQRDEPALNPSNFRFIVHEGNLYWIGVRVRSTDEAGRLRGPTTLLLASQSLLSGGVLLDPSAIWLMAAVLLGSALFWIPLVRRITVPLRKMRDAAGQMSRGNFQSRLSIDRGDEIGSLARSLNHLGTRLNEFVTGQKRFLGDIAHELGSPLARMQYGLGIIEQQAPSTLQPLLEDVREEVAQMSALLAEIQQFTKAGLHSELRLENVLLEEVLRQALARENVPAAIVRSQIAPGTAVNADARYLQRAIANILRNSLRYAGDSGPLWIDSKRSGNRLILSFADEGPGVPADLVHRLCDPFFRTESARTRESGGVGLGLAIVKRCVEACGGTVNIRNRSPHGLIVELALQAAEAPAN
jgi:two-component system sensor histidine kinase CpxA